MMETALFLVVILVLVSTAIGFGVGVSTVKLYQTGFFKKLGWAMLLIATVPANETQETKTANIEDEDVADV